MEKALATHSSTLAWKIPWTEEPGGLQSMGSLRVGNDWATSLSLSCIGEGNGNPCQCSCLENPRDGGAWWAVVSGVAQRQTRLKWLSSSAATLFDRWENQDPGDSCDYPKSYSQGRLHKTKCSSKGSDLSDTVWWGPFSVLLASTLILSSYELNVWLPQIPLLKP